jgi:hypothetical protein
MSPSSLLRRHRTTLNPHLGTISSLQKPEHETQVRPLVGLTPDQALRAWEYAAQKAGGRKITERMVKSAVNELGFAPQKQSGSAPVRTAKSERRLLITRTLSELPETEVLPQKSCFGRFLNRSQRSQRRPC